MALVYRTQQLTEIWANSGSAQDIQDAVDQAILAGGGTVYVPAGKFYWNNETVTIPGGVNVIGAGAGCDGYPNFNEYEAKTILHNNATPPIKNMFYIDGSNGKPVRISGIRFESEPPVNTDDFDIGDAVYGYKCINLRVDHCTFINFAHKAVALSNTPAGTASGVIDHCVIDNPYKLNSGSWSWAYGFYATGKAYWWNDTTAPLTDFLGQYPVKTGYPVLYVEDCKISRTRHAVDAIQGGWIVARYNYIDHPYPKNYGQLEVHGAGGGSWPSARGFEFYNNIVVGEPGEFAELCWLRGGGGVVFNNSFIMSRGYAIGLYKETCPLQPDEVLHNVWIWNNTVSGGSLLNNYGNFQENVDYFLRAPNQQEDGFVYTPYPYPHPLTKK
jgi:hypothetical protein